MCQCGWSRGRECDELLAECAGADCEELLEELAATEWRVASIVRGSAAQLLR